MALEREAFENEITALNAALDNMEREKADQSQSKLLKTLPVVVKHIFLKSQYSNDCCQHRPILF